MKNILLNLLLIVTITGCATVDSHTSALFSEFLRYEEGTNKSNIIEIADRYFSPSLLGESYKINFEVESQLLFKEYMAAIDGHYESVSGKEGCLIINGYDEDESPVVFSLKYISDNGHWLIDEIHIVYVETDKAFSDVAICPSDYLNK